jgi:glyoxylase-like metal-dependent hydrolase (beta-lactamase superfamily II)/rhodanese-related sulfurtransferase
MPSQTLPAGVLQVTVLAHPQGCRGYLVTDPASREALLLDAHLDQAREAAEIVRREGLVLRWVVDSHTHADHPSAAAWLAADLGATRVAHARSRHVGVTHRPDDGEPLRLGDASVVVRDAPGHTPDHIVLVAQGVLFSGDSLFIGGVARADFLGGDAGLLHDSIHGVMLALPDETLLYPGHDYAGQTRSTIGTERRENPWLRLPDRDAFVRNLEANPPPEPANMEALLRFNEEGAAIHPSIGAEEAVRVVRQGGAGTVIDVRTAEEVRAAHVPGSRHIVLDEILARTDEVRRTPAPRLILCRSGHRAALAREALAAAGVGGLRVIDGGILAYARAGGETAGGDPGAALEGGGCCAAAPPGA